MSVNYIPQHVSPYRPNSDYFNSINQSHTSAISQLMKIGSLANSMRANILDLNVGEAKFLTKLAPNLYNPSLAGIDVSTSMLRRAAANVDLKTIKGLSTNASLLVDVCSQDLVVAHFMYAYIPVSNIIEETAVMIKNNGLISYIATNDQSFPEVQKHLNEFIKQPSLMSNVLSHYYQNDNTNKTESQSLNPLSASIKQYKFKIAAHQRLHIPLTLYNAEELALFAMDNTWFLNAPNPNKMTKPFLLQKVKRLFQNIFTFPYHDTHIIDVVLAQKY
jgi:hypothetical protein